MKIRNGKNGQYRKSYHGKLLLLMGLIIILGVIYTDTSSTLVYEVPPAIIKRVEAIAQSLSSETDNAVKEAQARVQEERNQLLNEIAVLQKEQEAKVVRLKELESLGFTTEIKSP